MKNNNEKHLCDYGCGKEAKFYFKTSKKWYCSKNWGKCPVMREKLSIPQIGRIPGNKGKNITFRNKGEKMLEKQIS